MKSQALEEREGVEVCVQPHRTDPCGEEVRQRGIHHLLPDTLSSQLWSNDDGAEECEAIVRRRREHADHAPVALGRETTVRVEREQPPPVLARGAPRLEVRQGDRGVDGPLVEASGPRALHNRTRRSSSSGSSHSWYPYVT